MSNSPAVQRLHALSAAIGTDMPPAIAALPHWQRTARDNEQIATWLLCMVEQAGYEVVLVSNKSEKAWVGGSILPFRRRLR